MVLVGPEPSPEPADPHLETMVTQSAGAQAADQRPSGDEARDRTSDAPGFDLHQTAGAPEQEITSSAGNPSAVSLQELTPDVRPMGPDPAPNFPDAYDEVSFLGFPTIYFPCLCLFCLVSLAARC